jgi:hypothetical protein
MDPNAPRPFRYVTKNERNLAKGSTTEPTLLSKLLRTGQFENLIDEEGRHQINQHAEVRNPIVSAKNVAEQQQSQRASEPKRKSIETPRGVIEIDANENMLRAGAPATGSRGSHRSNGSNGSNSSSRKTSTDYENAVRLSTELMSGVKDTDEQSDIGTDGADSPRALLGTPPKERGVSSESITGIPSVNYVPG